MQQHLHVDVTDPHSFPKLYSEVESWAQGDDPYAHEEK